MILSQRRQSLTDSIEAERQNEDLSRPSTQSSQLTNPFSDSRPGRGSTASGSVSVKSSGFLFTPAAGARYFHSRRVPRIQGEPARKFKKDAKEKWLWIIPFFGCTLGMAIVTVMLYLKVGRVKTYNYCSILDDDFSSGILNPKIWTKEVQVGGFGNGQFEETTANDENVFIKGGQLYIKPTLQDEILITTNNTINLTQSGTCTSTLWSECVISTNTTNGTIVNPVKSGRINTKAGAAIKFGRVEVTAKIPQGDWMWPAIWMMPMSDTYGPWPASGEIDIMEGRGNNYTYPNGNNIVASALHWGPDGDNDRYRLTGNQKPALHSQFGDSFHIYGLEWTEKYIFTYIDTHLLQVFYWTFKSPFWPQGDFPSASENGTRYVDLWSQTGRPNTPFDQSFYLILNVAVGGRNGWFYDEIADKPWVDASDSAKLDFWKARDKWFPTWRKNGQMIVKRVRMWQQC